MKKLVTALCLTVVAAGALAQGTVNFNNTSATLVSTNGAARGLGVGATATYTSGGQVFYYALFTAPSTVSSLAASDLLTGTWTFSGIYASNTSTFATGGRFNGGLGAATLQGWPASQTNSYALASWSANIAGQNWSAVANQLVGANLAGGEWRGPNWNSTSDLGYFGVSAVGFGKAGGGSASDPAFSLFGAGPTATGTPITSGFTDFVVSVPEPTSFALAGLGAAALVIFRRRKA
jgi:hypothetical protein